MINMATSGTAWPGLKYKPITAVVDRVVNRYLRTQRKNMRRFFAERGLFDQLEQLERIRKSRQGPMAKNRMFREVLDNYAKLVNPAADAKADLSGAGAAESTSGSTPEPGAEATSAQDAERSVDVQDPVSAVPTGGARADADSSVQRLESLDSSGAVIEE